MAPRDEQVPVQAFVTHPTLEAFGERVPGRPCGRDMKPVEIQLLSEFRDGQRGDLRAVIADDAPVERAGR